jgi:hypothetical protein
MLMLAYQMQKSMLRVMAGEIHGVISRQEAWSRWRPYGERSRLDSPLDSEIDPDSLSPEDVLAITEHADFDTRDQIYWELPDDESQADDYQENLVRHVRRRGLTGRMPGLVLATHRRQERQARIWREQLLDEEPSRLVRIRNAVSELTKDGLISRSQADEINERCIAPDGEPLFEPTAMSALHVRRWDEELRGVVPVAYPEAGTDFHHGAAVFVANDEPQNHPHFRHNRVHEGVHCFIQGSELYDITDSNGVRTPQATVVGTFNLMPSTEVADPCDLSEVSDVELGEGLTEFVTRALVGVDGRLGRLLPESRDSRYGSFSRAASRLQRRHPTVFREALDASIVEATPDDPYAKRSALRRMHEVADREMGMPNALDTIFAKV